MQEKYDLRVVRTYKFLTEAFLQLMSEKRFENITINELCDRAMIRRTTFYKHFADKYEFLRFFIRQLQADFDAANAFSAEYTEPKVFYISIIRHLLYFLKEHEKFVQMALSSDLLPTILDILSEQITSDIAVKLKAGTKKGIAVPASPEIVAAFFAGAIVHTLKWWLPQKKEASEEKLIQEVEKILLMWDQPAIV